MIISTRFCGFDIDVGSQFHFICFDHQVEVAFEFLYNYTCLETAHVREVIFQETWLGDRELSCAYISFQSSCICHQRFLFYFAIGHGLCLGFIEIKPMHCQNVQTTQLSNILHIVVLAFLQLASVLIYQRVNTTDDKLHKMNLQMSFRGSSS